MRPSREHLLRAAPAVSVLAAMALVLAVPDLRTVFSDLLRGDVGEARERVDDLGLLAVAALLLLCLAHVLVPIPAELINAAAGFALGVPLGIAVMLAGWLLSALACARLADQVGRPVVTRVAGAHRLERLERLVARGGTRTFVVLRLIPLLPYNLVCAVGGLGRMPLWPYTWATAVGTLPLITICVVLGHRLRTPHLDDPVLWAAGAGLVALVLGSTVVVRRLGLLRAR